MSPYANPEAGYQAVQSGNSLLTQPLVDTPRTVTAVTQDVLRDKNATSVRELARTTLHGTAPIVGRVCGRAVTGRDRVTAKRSSA